MKYKALFLDMDGTVLPYADHGQPSSPSKKVVDAIKRASKKVHVCIATGRSFYRLSEHPFVKKLSTYAIANDGGVVYDFASQEVLYDRRILEEDMPKAAGEFAQFESYELAYFDRDETIYGHGCIHELPYSMFAYTRLCREDAEEFVRRFHGISTVNAYIYPRHLEPNEYAVIVRHAEATKLHGVEVIFKELGISREETLGVGDSTNDYQLLMACGKKVAMGNAVQELKDIADYTAPHVDDDGVVDVIEKFVL